MKLLAIGLLGHLCLVATTASSQPTPPTTRLAWQAAMAAIAVACDRRDANWGNRVLHGINVTFQADPAALGVPTERVAFSRMPSRDHFAALYGSVGAALRIGEIIVTRLGTRIACSAISEEVSLTIVDGVARSGQGNDEEIAKVSREFLEVLSPEALDAAYARTVVEIAGLCRIRNAKWIEVAVYIPSLVLSDIRKIAIGPPPTNERNERSIRWRATGARSMGEYAGAALYQEFGLRLCHSVRISPELATLDRGVTEIMRAPLSRRPQ